MLRQKERRHITEPLPVRNKSVEVGVNLNNILTALILAGLLWAGNTLNDLKKSMELFGVNMAIVQTENNGLRREFEEHKHDQNAHTKYGTRR